MARVRTAVVAATDTGRKRSHNEDHHVIWVPEDAAGRERHGVLLVVADGMGGSVGGEVASHLAAEAVVRSYGASDGTEPAEALRHAVEEANRAVFEKTQESPELTGMGTTCTAVVLRGLDAWFAHVGDSRAYLARDGGLRQITQDHSLVAALVERNELSPEQARTDSRRNVVTRSVGVGPTVEVDARRVPFAIEPGDTLLVCSDGLHGQVTDEEMAETVSRSDLKTACEDLIELANARGGPDNITLVLARLEPVPETASGSRAASPARPARRRHGRTWLLLLLALVALGLAVWSIVWLAGEMNRESQRVGFGDAAAAAEDLA